MPWKHAARNGALDAYMTPIYMKKSRPALALTVLCEETDKAALVRTLFAHTSTLGVREYPFSRYEMERSTYSISVEGKQIHIKRASGYGISREKAEYEDLSQLAATEGISLRQARERVQQALWLARWVVVNLRLFRGHVHDLLVVLKSHFLIFIFKYSSRAPS